MAGDKIILGGKSRPLSEKPKEEKEKKAKGAKEEADCGTLNMFKVLLMCFGVWGHRVRGSGSWKSLRFRCIFP